MLRYSRASRFSGYNKLGDKKMYTKQHYYALYVQHTQFSSLFPLCRLIIERQHKILVTHFARKATGALFVAGNERCFNVYSGGPARNEKRERMEIHVLFDARAFVLGLTICEFYRRN